PPKTTHKSPIATAPVDLATSPPFKRGRGRPPKGLPPLSSNLPLPAPATPSPIPVCSSTLEPSPTFATPFLPSPSSGHVDDTPLFKTPAPAACTGSRSTRSSLSLTTPATRRHKNTEPYMASLEARYINRHAPDYESISAERVHALDAALPPLEGQPLRLPGEPQPVAATAAEAPPSALAAAAAESADGEGGLAALAAALAAAKAAAAEKERRRKEEEARTPIVLREGWGYKIGATKWRAVHDPTRKTPVPKQPPVPAAASAFAALPPVKSEDQAAADELEEDDEEYEEDDVTGKPLVYIDVHPTEYGPATKPPTTKRAREKLVASMRRKHRAKVQQQDEENGSPKKYRMKSDAWKRIKYGDRVAAEVVKKVYDERMEQMADTACAENIGMLIKIIEQQVDSQLPEEHEYTTNGFEAEVVTTFQRDQMGNFERKRFKPDHVLIATSDFEEIHAIVSRMRVGRRKWMRVQARMAADETVRAAQRAKKERFNIRQREIMAAMSPERKAAYNKKKAAEQRARKMELLEKDPEALAAYHAKKDHSAKRRLAQLEKDRMLLEMAPPDDPEERRRIRRRIQAAEATEEQRARWKERDRGYGRKKREKEATMDPEELAEERRLKRERWAALADLPPKERVKAQQRQYQAAHKAKRAARRAEAAARGSPLSPSPPRKRRRKRVKMEEEDEDGDGSIIKREMITGDPEVDEEYADGQQEQMSFDYGAMTKQETSYEENMTAVQAIESPSPSRPDAVHHHYAHSYHDYAHHHHEMEEEDQEGMGADDDGDVDVMHIEDPGPSPVPQQMQLQQHERYYRQQQPQQRQMLQQQRYATADLEAELIQLRKDVAWSDKAIHNSRVEVDRLRNEADNLDIAIEQELVTQMERKRRIALLTTMWREEHTEDSQG
ncbi:hypothetical protein PFISCL1PPCAC_21986, partial [Pristionchus fissidentatus]